MKAPGSAVRRLAKGAGWAAIGVALIGYAVALPSPSLGQGIDDFEALDSIVIPIPGLAPGRAPQPPQQMLPPPPAPAPVPASESAPPISIPDAGRAGPDVARDTAPQPLPGIRADMLFQPISPAGRPGNAPPPVSAAPAPVFQGDAGVTGGAAGGVAGGAAGVGPLERSGMDAAGAAVVETVDTVDRGGGPPVVSTLTPVSGVEPVRADGRVLGEAPDARFNLFVSAVPVAPQIQLHYQSGVDILPDASELSVLVNGQFIGSFQPDAALRARTVLLDVPASLLQIGRNVVEITGRQRHRVACGPDAAFDLWTSLDLRTSGLTGSGDGSFGEGASGPSSSRAADAAMLAVAASRTMAEGRPIAVTFERPGDVNALRAVLAAAEEIGVLMGGRVPDYVVRSNTFTPPGQDADAARIRLFPADRNNARIVRGGDGAVVLAIDYADDGVVGVVRDLFPSLPSPSVLTPVTGRAVPFAAFDIPDMLVSERYRRADIPFRMPEDWFVENDELAEIALDYAYLRGLPLQSQLILSVNGNTVRLLPLDQGGGAVIEAFPVSFPARLLSPGMNAITIETRIPGRPATAACADVYAADIPPMAGIFRTSTLTVPDGSPFRSIPDLSPLTAAPGTADRQAIVLDIGAGSTTQIARSLTVAGALSSALGQSAELTIASGADWSTRTGENEVRLRVIRPVDLTNADLAGYGLTLQDVLPRLSTSHTPMPSAFQTAVMRDDGRSAIDMMSQTVSGNQTGVGPGPVADLQTRLNRSGDAQGPRLQRPEGDSARVLWDRPAESGASAFAPDEQGILNGLMMGVSSIPNRLWRFAGALGWVTSSDPALLMAGLDDPATALVFDRIVDGDRSILVVADGAEDVRRLASVLATGTPGAGPRGSLAVVSADGWWINYRGGARTIEQTGPISPDRLLPAAGTLASAYPVGFIILVMAALGIAAVATSRVFLHLGDTGDRS